MKGIAGSVNSIALQADLFAKHQAFSNPIFSNINREKDGVHFDLVVDINPTNLRYVNLLQGAAPAASAVPGFQQGGAAPDDSGVPIFAP